MHETRRSSRLPGFHAMPRHERLSVLRTWLGEEGADRVDPLQALKRAGLDEEAADLLSENVVGLHALPFSVVPNFLINGREVLVPMVTEEPSVVAAAANAARMVREGGGFKVEVGPPIMIGQIQLAVESIEAATAILVEQKESLLALAAEVDPLLCKLGGGPRDLRVRILPEDGESPAELVVHLLVDVRDAMGANAVNSMSEALAPRIETLTGGRVGLRIISNLADQRLVRCICHVPLSVLGTQDFKAERIREGILSASRFAERDPYRAATHNKGIMNGVDAVVLASGNDWRAVESGAHAYAARSGRYAPLCIWREASDGGLKGLCEMPMAIGTVGGATKVHGNARLSLALMGITCAKDLAEVVVSAGVANNLAALRALGGEGIQKGHMRLHDRSRILAKGV